MQTAASAARAYASLAKLGDPGIGGATGLGDTAGTSQGFNQSFGALVRDVMTQVGETARASDAQAQAMAAGKANVVDVVTAVAESEVAVDALVAVRDKVIAAYEEIMRMPI
jgi:flagellar hook-basal body complex protein FliE